MVHSIKDIHQGKILFRLTVGLLSANSSYEKRHGHILQGRKILKKHGRLEDKSHFPVSQGAKVLRRNLVHIQSGVVDFSVVPSGKKSSHRKKSRLAASALSCYCNHLPLLKGKVDVTENKKVSSSVLQVGFGDIFHFQKLIFHL